MIETVDGLFRESVRHFPDRIFLRHLTAHGTTSITYAQAAVRVAGSVRRLADAGLAPGSRAVACADAMVDSVFLFIACAHAGVVLAPLSPSSSIEMVRSLQHHVDARAVFASAPDVPRLSAAGLAPTALGPPLEFELDLPAALKLLEQAGQGHSADSVYMLQPTSGTTAQPKLVIRSHRAFSRAARMLSGNLFAADAPAQRVLMVAALTHGMGQYLLSIGLTLAAEFCVPEKSDTAASLPQVRQLDPTYIVLTPRVLRSFVDQQAALEGPTPSRPLFGPGARLLNIGGAECDPVLMRRVSAQGLEVKVAYGASEISVVSITEPGQWKEGSAGKILPDVELKIADDGELLAKTPVMMVGYHGAQALTEQAFTADGFYQTGDFAEITEDGELRILGRKRDVFNTFDGSNIFPGRIETMIETLPWVSQAVLVGDQRPFLTALLVIKDSTQAGDARRLGQLDEQKFASLYSRAYSDLAPINASNEANERVLRVVLFDRAMASELYAIVGHGKTKRDRAKIVQAYAGSISELYPTGKPA